VVKVTELVSARRFKYGQIPEIGLGASLLYNARQGGEKGCRCLLKTPEGIYKHVLLIHRQGTRKK
jgi:hypothetical protein